MTGLSSLTIDYTQESSLTHPSPALLSSRGAGWDRLHLGLYPMPAYATPEHCSTHHIVFINYGDQLDIRQKIDGRSATVNFPQVQLVFFLQPPVSKLNGIRILPFSIFIWNQPSSLKQAWNTVAMSRLSWFPKWVFSTH